ncbi:conserved hypothetical protein [Ricinus communis]|uniref:Uncharacterized protein n=1 Tax=Ricinus communis TaxID=3988 RepID=B9TFJ9_RICCO|nr:conserved hypothetical protein [Ricinus communis]
MTAAALVVAVAGSFPALGTPLGGPPGLRVGTPYMAGVDSLTGLTLSTAASSLYKSQYADALNARGVRYLKIACVDTGHGQTAYATTWSPYPEGKAAQVGPTQTTACRPGPLAVIKVLAPPGYLGPGASIAAYLDTQVSWSVVRAESANFMYALPRLDRTLASRP